MGNYMGGGGTVNGFQVPPGGAVVAGQEGNGQFQFISHGSSSFSDGKNQYTGSQLYHNLNGQVHQETTGNLPEGFFQSISSNPAPVATTAALVLICGVMIVAIFSVLTRRTRHNHHKRQLELRNRRNLIITTSARNLTRDDHSTQEGPYFNQQKRPFADVMWNSELLAEDQFVEVNVDG